MEKNLLDLYNSSNQFGKVHGMTYEILEPGHIVYHFTPGQQHMATATVVHGGMIAAFMDAIISVAALSAVYQEQKLIATVEFKINYTAQASPGQPLTGTGQVIQKGKSMLVAKGEITDINGKLIATALGTLKAYPHQQA